jgi:hypothetical protein
VKRDWPAGLKHRRKVFRAESQQIESKENPRPKSWSTCFVVETRQLAHPYQENATIFARSPENVSEGIESKICRQRRLQPPSLKDNKFPISFTFWDRSQKVYHNLTGCEHPVRTLAISPLEFTQAQTNSPTVHDSSQHRVTL